MDSVVQNGLIAVLVVFFIFYCGVLFWAFCRKNRKRLEELGNIPLAED